LLRWNTLECSHPVKFTFFSFKENSTPFRKRIESAPRLHGMTPRRNQIPFPIFPKKEIFSPRDSRKGNNYLFWRKKRKERKKISGKHSHNGDTDLRQILNKDLGRKAAGRQQGRRGAGRQRGGAGGAGGGTESLCRGHIEN